MYSISIMYIPKEVCVLFNHTNCIFILKHYRPDQTTCHRLHLYILIMFVVPLYGYYASIYKLNSLILFAYVILAVINAINFCGMNNNNIQVGFSFQINIITNNIANVKLSNNILELYLILVLIKFFHSSVVQDGGVSFGRQKKKTWHNFV